MIGWSSIIHIKLLLTDQVLNHEHIKNEGFENRHAKCINIRKSVLSAREKLAQKMHENAENWH